MATLIYPELSYKLVGILFKVHTDLGPSYTEKQYQKAVEIQLRNSKISFEREKEISLPYENDQIGQFYTDFIIEDKIILEIKTVKFLRPQDIKQALKYLNALNLKLAILANFRRERLEYKRIINNKMK
jgi:GxxExxY protein